MSFNGVDDMVGFYCPVCDENTIHPVGENYFQCRRCGVEVFVRGFFLFWSRALTEEERKREMEKGNIPCQLPKLPEGRWVAITGLYDMGGDVTIISESEEVYDLYNVVCPGCGSRRLRIWAEDTCFLLECLECNGRFFMGRKRE